jgi:hypothetical protein
VRPRPELCVPPVTWKCAEYLHPNLLRDVRRQINVTTQAPYHGIDVGRMLHPQRPQRGFVAVTGALNEKLIGGHPVSVEVSHPRTYEGFPRKVRPSVRRMGHPRGECARCRFSRGMRLATPCRTQRVKRSLLHVFSIAPYPNIRNFESSDDVATRGPSGQTHRDSCLPKSGWWQQCFAS